MKSYIQFLRSFLVILILGVFVPAAYGETTMEVNFMQRTSNVVIDPTLPGGNFDQTIPIKCILYKESGRCVFDPDIEAVQTYEIYSGTQRLGIYSSQSSFVHDVFSFRGILYLTLKTRNSELTGKVYNY